MNEKEKEENMNNAVDIINNMHTDDKETMLHILDDKADTIERKETFKKLTDKIKEKEPNEDISDMMMDNYDIVRQFNEQYEPKEIKLADEQLGDMANDFIEDLFNECKEEDKDKKEQEKEKNINKAANIIKELNKNEQNKVLSYLNDHADDDIKKEIIKKVSNLINNMNDIKLYLKGFVKKKLNNEKQKNELEKEKLDDLNKNVVNNLFEEEKKIDNIEEDKKDEIPLEEKGISAPIKTEEKINNVVGILNQLHVNDKEKLLKALEQNAKDDKKQKTLSQLRDKIRKVHQLNILVGSMKKNEKLTEEEIDEIAYNFSYDLYYKDNQIVL